MRVTALIIAFTIGAYYAVQSPFYGLLFYLWFAYFRPDYFIGWIDLVWELGLSSKIGYFLLVSTVITGQRFRFGLGEVLLLLFLVWTLLSALFSALPEVAWLFWRNFAPSVIFAYVLVMLTTDERRLRLVLLTIGVSFAAEAAKQGWFEFILNPGAENINRHFMFGDNNGVAVGMFMLLPILLALARTTPWLAERMFHRALAVGVLYRALMTYSRGGFLTCGAVALHYLARTPRRMRALVAAAVVALAIAPVLPEAYWYRMGTILVSSDDLEAQDTDRSIRGRIHYWSVALIMAQDNPFLGVGTALFNSQYDRYDFSDGEFLRRRSVHSTWLGILCEAGIPGFVLEVWLIGYAFLICWRTRRLAKHRPEFADLGIYASAIEAALLAFCVGGTFVALQYAEMLFHLVGISLAMNRIVKGRLAASRPERSVVAVAPVPRVRIPAAAAVAPAARGLGRI
jgi:probable O-glycosylation ligase (exosortase A-associated)